MKNIFGRLLIIIIIAGLLSLGLTAIVNNASTYSSFPQRESGQRFMPDQSGDSNQINSTQVFSHETDPGGEVGSGLFAREIGKNLGVFALITLIIVLIQKGIKRIALQKQNAPG